jgi:tetratricopeptide (TPR) repeat protein
MDDIRREIEALPAEAPFVEWARWFLSESPNRSIAPGFTVTPADAKTLAEAMRAPDPLITLIQRSNQARNQRRWEDAIALDREAMEFVRKEYGPETKVLSDLLFRLAQTFIGAGRLTEAESTARESLVLRGKFYNDTDWHQADTQSVIAEALSRQGRRAEAEPILLKAYARLEQLDPDVATGAGAAGQQGRARATANVLAQLYTATNQPAKAAEWRQKAAAPAPVAPVVPQN